MNTIFQENLNEMIHHAQQKSSNISFQRPHQAERLLDHGSAPETRSHLGSAATGGTATAPLHIS